MGKIYSFIKALKKDTEPLNYGREIIVEWAEQACQRKEEVTVLDLGLGEGTDLLNIKNALQGKKLHLHGLESYAPNVKKAKENGIEVSIFNLERERFPYEDQSIDLIIANQVLEHTKEIIWITSEISRILKWGGVFLCGVPNLASLHNRIALLFGEQPPTIKVLGPHVRGYCRRSFCEFIETDGYFKVKGVRGSNFYPFPESMSKFLSRYFRGMAVSTFYLVERREKQGVFKEILRSRFFETPYFIGKT